MSMCCVTIKQEVATLYRIRTNIVGYNIWQIVKIMDLVRYNLAKSFKSNCGHNSYTIEKILARFKLCDCMAIRQI